MGSTSLDKIQCHCDTKYLDLANGQFYNFLDNVKSLKCKCYKSLDLEENNLDFFPSDFSNFVQLTNVNIGNNNFTSIPYEICAIVTLKSFTAKCNLIDDDGIPEKITKLINLEKIDLCGNKLKSIPNPLLELAQLKELDLGANLISRISSSIKNMKNLEYLYLGGNKLNGIPIEMGQLTRMRVLSLSDNLIREIPASLGNLHRLESLSLHKNILHTLPPAIVRLKRLKELSLRNNPLVRHFVQTIDWEVPSLLELSGRIVIQYRNTLLSNVNFDEELPCNLVHYLSSSHKCANPNCSGVYFSSCVEHIKFTDFCGKYRMPLMAYLCSPTCQISDYNPFHRRDSSDNVSSSSEDDSQNFNRVRKVLLG